MEHGWKYSVAISELLSDQYPSLLQGDLEVMIRKAEGLGYDAVELHLESPDQVDADAICALKEELGIEISAISSGLAYTRGELSLFSDDDGIRNLARDRFIDFVDLSEKLGCMLILGLMKGDLLSGRSIEEADGLLDSYLQEVLVYAQKKGVTLLLEPIHRFLTNYMNNVAHVTDYVERIQFRNFKSLIDTYHMNIEEESMIDPLYYAQRHLGYFHISDSNRRAPGLGHIDFLSVLNTLDEIGYRGYLSVECLPFPTQEESATHSLRYLKAIERAIQLRRIG